MSQYDRPVPEGKDPALWETAQKRASFKGHLMTYIIVNTFLWALWYFTSFRHMNGNWNLYPWPMWTTLGWGIGLAFHFAGAFVFPRVNSTEREYEKLKKNNNV